jgi:tetratricopeptide (TPR) repeat protein
MASDRLETLRGMVEQNPADSRTRYMLAMELGNNGDFAGALEQYKKIIEVDADYVAAYFHGGQTLEKLDRPDEAREIYSAGITACGRTGDDHTRDELQEALEAL